MPVSTVLSIRENPLPAGLSSDFMTKFTHTLPRRPKKFFKVKSTAQSWQTFISSAPAMSGTSGHSTTNAANYACQRGVLAISSVLAQVEDNLHVAAAIHREVFRPTHAKGRGASCPVVHRNLAWVARSILLAHSGRVPGVAATCSAHCGSSYGAAKTKQTQPDDDQVAVFSSLD